MNQLRAIRSAASQLPELVATSGERATRRFIDFFTSNIRNRRTREAYGRAVNEFLRWCEVHRVHSLAQVASFDEWRSLCRAIDQPALAADPRFRTRAARKQN